MIKELKLEVIYDLDKVKLPPIGQDDPYTWARGFNYAVRMMQGQDQNETTE